MTLRCPRCDFAIAVKLSRPRFGFTRGPGCNEPLGPAAEDIFSRLKQALLDAKSAEGRLAVEFELQEEDQR